MKEQVEGGVRRRKWWQIQRRREQEVVAMRVTRHMQKKIKYRERSKESK